MAIKIAWPDCQITLMESTKRKYEFLNLAARARASKACACLRKSAGQEHIAEGTFMPLSNALWRRC